MGFVAKSTAASIARALLGIVAAFLIQNGLTDEKTANDFVSNNVELVAGIVIAIGALVWIVMKNKFSNTAFWKAIFSEPGTPPEEVLDKTTKETGLPEMLKF